MAKGKKKIGVLDEAQKENPVLPEPVAAVSSIVQPSEVRAVNQHIYQEPKLAFGECLVIALDAAGNEYGEPFVTSIKTAEKVYLEPKFRIKKKYN